MTWEPKNKTDDDDDAILTDSEDNKDKDEMGSEHRSDRVGDDSQRSLDDNGNNFIIFTPRIPISAQFTVPNLTSPRNLTFI